MGWGVNATPRPLYPRERPGTLCIGGWVAPGPVWTGAENLAPTGIPPTDRPARSESLYRLSYPDPAPGYRQDRIYWIRSRGQSTVGSPLASGCGGDCNSSPYKPARCKLSHGAKGDQEHGTQIWAAQDQGTWLSSWGKLPCDVRLCFMASVGQLHAEQ